MWDGGSLEQQKGTSGGEGGDRLKKKKGNAPEKAYCLKTFGVVGFFPMSSIGRGKQT